MIGRITYIISTAGFRAMDGVISDERRRLDNAIAPAAYVSYDPRMMSVVGWHGYRIAFKGGTRNMILYALELLRKNYAVSERYDNYEDGNYVVGVLLRERTRAYAFKTGTPEPEPDPKWLYFTMPNGGVVTLTKTGAPTDVTLEYSLDNGSTWTTWSEVGNVRTLTLAAGQTMHVRNTSETSTSFSTSTSDYYKFSFSDVTNAYGDTRSLLCANPSDGVITAYVFAYLFRSCATLITAPELPAMSLALNCYAYMFSSCTSLVTAPELPAMSLDARCYRSMFSGCTSLVTAPELPAMSLEQYCYNAMFSGCSSLNEVTMSATDISANNCIYAWLSGVSATGDFYCPAVLTIPTGTSGIPSGWTRHDI